MTADWLVLGGGVVGLAIALELRLAGEQVTVLSRKRQEAAGRVAAGMLAPLAEGLPPGPLLDLGIRSRDLYPTWTARLEALTGQSSGYWPCGILVPVGESSQRQDLSTYSWGQWLSPPELSRFQPGLGDWVGSAHWFADDAQVDPRRCLMPALWQAMAALEVDLREGVEVQELLVQGDCLEGVATNQGLFNAHHYILSLGAWSGTCLPLPVYPVKGQMFSVRQPYDAAIPLKTVLFGPGIYIVPRQDGLVVVGATAETVGFREGNTPLSLSDLMAAASRLFPPLADYPLEEVWWGYRPATIDSLPILGNSPYANLSLATGHYRNGILLAPLTAQLLVQQLLHKQTDPLLQYFRWDRPGLQIQRNPVGQALGRDSRRQPQPSP
jgi:thiazole synthase